MIGGGEYFDGIGRLTIEGMRDEERSSEVTDAVSGLYESLSTEHTAHKWTHDSPEYLPFKDVQLLLGGRPDDASAALEVPFWRVRIEAIEGFLLGGSIRNLPLSNAPPGRDKDPTAERGE